MDEWAGFKQKAWKLGFSYLVHNMKDNVSDIHSRHTNIQKVPPSTGSGTSGRGRGRGGKGEVENRDYNKSKI